MGVDGYLCDDSLSQAEADVICRMMDLDTAIALRGNAFTTHGINIDIAWMKNLTCTGQESSVFDCSYTDLSLLKDLECNRVLNASTVVCFNRNVTYGIYCMTVEMMREIIKLK
jgi:hypothetical protein